MRTESQKHRNSAGNGEAGADRPIGARTGPKSETPREPQDKKIYPAKAAKRRAKGSEKPDPSRLIGSLVRSEAGHDRGGILVVVGVTEDGTAGRPGNPTVLLADGKLRRLEKPKAKKLRHVTVLEERPEGRDELVRRLESRSPIQNAELRKYIARSLAEPIENEGGAEERKNTGKEE